MGSGLVASLVDPDGPPRERPGAAAVDGAERVGSGGAGSSFAVSAGWTVLGGALAVFGFAPWRDAQETNVRPVATARRREIVERMMRRLNRMAARAATKFPRGLLWVSAGGRRYG